jgi:hypothetical protein
MSSRASISAKDELVAQILEQFDQKDKEDLALQLVRSLKLDQYGLSYPTQVARMLNRDLTEDEKFKLDVLDRILKFHAGEGGEGESEEEEEEEE